MGEQYGGSRRSNIDFSTNQGQSHKDEGVSRREYAFLRGLSGRLYLSQIAIVSQEMKHIIIY
jgi:hypothetical protein